MGDLTFLVPSATTTPEAAAAAKPAEPAETAAAGPAPRCRRVHFRDLSAATLWFPPSPPDDAMAEGEPPPPPEEETVGGAAAGEPEEDRMDLLWEDFNEELLAMRRAGGPSCSRDHQLPPSDSSDGEYEPAAAAAGRGVPGCFPVLRPSARAGGAGHYRRRAGSWVLLMRIFRRLFVVEKAITAGASNSSSRHATAAR